MFQRFRPLPVLLSFVLGLFLCVDFPTSCLAQQTTRANTPAAEAENGYDIGLARIDVTPETPIRMSGYGNRLTESEGVEQRLFAKAMAVRSPATGQTPATTLVLVTVDTLGVTDAITGSVAERLQTKHKLPRANLAICASHTHTGPIVAGVARLILTGDVPAEQRKHIDDYTAELTTKLGDVAEAAIADLRPGRIAHAVGRVGFAINRRLLRDGKWAGFGSIPEGAVDHALPVLFVYEPGEAGKLRGVVINYACHCTTLGGKVMTLHGDWAGCFQEQWEREHPGTTALVSIGCGADANPEPRSDDRAVVVGFGDQLVREVKRLVGETQSPLSGTLGAKREEFTLPLADPPTKAEFEERLKGKGPIVTHAKLNLERLARGEKLPTTVPYSAQAWSFGTSLAMVFLPGEVVVGYQRRLQSELNAARLWVNAYSNDLPCYIADETMLPQGGYEVDSSMYYYDRPQHFRPEVEATLIAGVHRVMPDAFQPTQRWKSELARIEAQDRATPPPTGGILFIGSSTIRMWKLDQCFPNLPTINHGFGGSAIADSNYFFERLVTPVKPRQIVLYAGGNDINGGKTPEQVARDFARFATLVRKHLPNARLTYIAIAPNPKRWHFIDQTRAANRLIEGLIGRMDPQKNEFVEIEDDLLDADGKLQPQLYLKDELHLNDAGYEVLTRAVLPHLK